MQNITQLDDDRITQFRDDSRGIRQYIPAEKIKLLAQTKFKESCEGLTYKDLVNGGLIKSADCEQAARDTLYYHYGEGHLFTFERTNPQQYFATPDDAEMAALYREKNTHSHPTEGSGLHPLQMGTLLRAAQELRSLTLWSIARRRTFIMS